MKRTISAVIITFNQAHKIGAAIKAVQQCVDEVIVVDSGSTDDTVVIAQNAGAKVFYRAWEWYSLQKNFGNLQAENDWIISIDDDEVISEDLATSINQLLSDKSTFDAIDLPFRTIFCGKLIRFGGWNPESHIRVFNKKIIKWNTDAVHEGLTIQPHHRIAKAKGWVYHYTVDTLAQFYKKTELYSDLFAKKALKQGKKASFVKLWLSPVFRFFVEFFVKLGFLDGYFGFVIAKENTRYTFLKYKKINRSLANEGS